MKNFDNKGLVICTLQAKLFEMSVQQSTLSSPVFIRYFMRSEEAVLLDDTSYLFSSSDCERIIHDMNEKYGKIQGNKKFSEQSMYWMGYLYRYFSYTRDINSKTVYGIIKPQELHALYLPYHTLDPGAAVDRILEAKNIKNQNLALDSLKKAYSIED